MYWLGVLSLMICRRSIHGLREKQNNVIQQGGYYIETFILSGGPGSCFTDSEHISTFYVGKAFSVGSGFSCSGSRQ